MASQTISRAQLVQPSPDIRNKLVRIPRTGTKGTHGVLNGRGIDGCVRRIIKIPAQTITNAKSVPMLVISPTTAIGANAANNSTNNISTKLQRHGVRNFGCTLLKSAGSNPSCDIE